MALQCQMTVNYTAYQAGQNPPPMATLQVFNPNASAIAVKGIELQYFDVRGNTISPSTNKPTPAMGPGQNGTVPALSSLTFGPFPIVFGSAANMNSFLDVSTPNPPTAAQPYHMNNEVAFPPQTVVLVGAIVTGTDGSSNVAGTAPIIVSYTTPPPVSFQGGFLNFAAPNNMVLGVL